MSIPKYTNLIKARYELVQYLESVGEHHLTRSFIEKAIKNIDKVMENNQTTKACTPKIGYVDKVLKTTGRY